MSPGSMQTSPQSMTGSPATSLTTRKLRKSCDYCQEGKVRCSQHKPSCQRCVKHQRPCVYSVQRRIGRPSNSIARKDCATHMQQMPAKQINVGYNNHVTTDATYSDDATNIQERNHMHENDSFLFDTIIASSFSPSLQTSSTSDAIGQHDIMFPSDPAVTNTISSESATASTSPSSNGIFNRSLLGTDFDLPYSVGVIDDANNNQTLNLGIHGSHVPLNHEMRLDGIRGVSDRSGCGYQCYASMLKQLLYFGAVLPDSVQPGIDVILQAERELRVHQKHVLTCSTCKSNNYSLLQLATIAERIVSMLDCILERKAVIDTENARLTKRVSSNPWGHKATHLSGSPERNVCQIPLRVGAHELDSDSKQRFLKQLLQLRLKRLTAVLAEIRDETTVQPRSSIFQASELLLNESLQRLESLRGQVLIWN